ncbi:GNAT family N-acetyltransferase [Iodobacter sp.]|uniref:GNAT family N-acetyltransferase n=1 Tax=Iodobacter sp. TaxID=1915058 RepID=UPI0025FEE88D|nr:GNAT family N-acetyltransferase [Iodobacter sp.]
MHRLASASDFASVYSIYMHEEVVPFLGFDPLSKEEFEPIFASLVRSNGFFVVELGGVVKGFYRVTKHEGRANHSAYLGTLAVSPDEKGSGFAFSMMTEAIKNLSAKGILRVELMLEADNPRALAFYKKLGFIQEGIMRSAYKRSNQAHYIDELFLAKLLQPLLGGSNV